MEFKLIEALKVIKNHCDNEPNCQNCIYYEGLQCKFESDPCCWDLSDLEKDGEKVE